MGGSLATPKVGQLSWTTFVGNSIDENILGELSWTTLLRDSLGTLPWEISWGAIFGSSLDIHTSDKKTTSVMQFPPGNRITLVSPSVFDIHTRDNTSFVFWQIVKPTRFVSISFHKKKGGDVTECCLFFPSPVAFTLFVWKSGTEQGSFCSYSRSSSRFPLEHHRKTNYSGTVRVILFGGGPFWCPSPIRNLINKKSGRLTSRLQKNIFFFWFQKHFFFSRR